jgi:hypothetical protein
MVIFHSYVSLLEGNHIPYIHHFQINVLPAPTAGLLLRFENHLCLCGKTAASPHPNILQLGSNEWGIPSGNHNGKSLTNGGVYWNMIAGCLTAIYRISHPFSENSANWGCIYVPSISGISDLDQQKPRKIDGFLHVGVDFGISSNWGSHIRVCLVPMSLHNYLQIHTEYIYIYMYISYHQKWSNMEILRKSMEKSENPWDNQGKIHDKMEMWMGKTKTHCWGFNGKQL